MNNDGRFPDDSAVMIRYPRSASDNDREAWPWLTGSVLQQCGPEEWQVCVEVRELATLEDGSSPPAGTPDHDLYYPTCFRDSSELALQLSLDDV